VALSKRDTNIVYITMGLLMAYVLWQFGVAPIWDRYTEMRDELAAQEEIHSENQQTLDQAREIEEGYKRVEAQFPPDVPDRDPADVFSEEVTSLVTRIVGNQPTFSPTTEEPIKDVKDYQMLTFPVTVKGEFKPLSDLLKAFDQRGYLVRTATLTREPDLNKNDLTLDVTLARIVKIPEEDEPVGPPRPGTLTLGKKL